MRPAAPHRIVGPLIFLLAIQALVVPSRAQQPSASQSLPAPAIVIVDMQQILRDAKAAKGTQTTINQQYTSYSKQVAQQEDELQKGRAELERQRTILAPDAFNVRARELQQRYDDLTHIFEGKRQALQQSYNDAMVKVENMALEIIADIVKERKANLVLQKQAVLFEADGLDITADAMARLDQKLPSVPVNLPDGEGGAPKAKSDAPAKKK